MAKRKMTEFYQLKFFNETGSFYYTGNTDCYNDKFSKFGEDATSIPDIDNAIAIADVARKDKGYNDYEIIDVYI